jgi:hypothetical protein
MSRSKVLTQLPLEVDKDWMEQVCDGDALTSTKEKMGCESVGNQGQEKVHYCSGGHCGPLNSTS